MTTEAPTIASAAAASPERLDPEPVAPVVRTYASQVLVDTFANWRSRVSALWIGLLVVCAVFAPFLANSHPLLLQQGGRWSSPLLRHLTPTDVSLLVAAAATVTVVVRRMRFGRALAVVLWFTALAAALTLWPAAAAGELFHTRPGLRHAARPVLAGLAVTMLVFGAVALLGASLFVERLEGWLPRAGLAVGAAALAAAGFRLARGQPLEASVVGAILWSIVLIPAIARPPARTARVCGALAAALIVLLIALPVRPPVTINYAQYREDARAGLTQFALHAPVRYSPLDRQFALDLREPDREHWFGTDAVGQDVLSRIVHASRIALAVGFISTGIAVIIGVVVGGVMGYFGGRVDLLGMRLIEIFEAIPTLFLLITIVAFFGRSMYLIMAVIGLRSWTGDARFIRAEFLRLRNQDFVHAAKAAGLPLRSILFRHMLPNGITPVLVAASFGVASAILLESILSFLGLGLVEEPSWGAMLEQARHSGRFVWWLALYPGMAIFLTVFAYNLIGESLRDALDPKLRGIK